MYKSSSVPIFTRAERILICFCQDCTTHMGERLLDVQEIMRDKWINVGYEDAQIEPYEEPTLQLEDEVRIAELLQLGFKRDDIHESLVGRKFDTIYATYMLLGRKVRSSSVALVLSPLRASSASHIISFSSLSLSLSLTHTHTHTTIAVYYRRTCGCGVPIAHPPFFAPSEHFLWLMASTN